MKIEEIKAAVDIEEYAASVLQRRGKSYICPYCNSGNKVHGTSAVSFKDGRFHCFSCHTSGDVLDLAGVVHGTDDKTEQKQIVMDWAGLRDSESAPPLQAKGKRPERRAEEGGPLDGLSEQVKANRKRHAELMEQWRANIGHPDAAAYLETRGWTVEEARAAGIGYDPTAPLYRLIIPWKGTEGYHIDRDVTGTATHKYYKHPTAELGKQPLYNPSAVEAGDPERVVFVVEGLMDALAVERSGYEAVALGGTADANHGLRSRLQAAGYRAPNIVLMLDHDEAGRRGTSLLLDELHDAGVSRVADASLIAPHPDVLEGCKDADEYAAKHGKEALASVLDGLTAAARAAKRELEEAEYRASMDRLNILDPVETMQGIFRGDNMDEPIPTGLATIDEALGGGLRRGLFVMGAVSSMGKTTLTLQIADSIVAMGRTALFVTIEQSAAELVSKSLSRHMRTYGYAVPDVAIRSVERRTWGGDKQAAFWDACTDYANMTNGRLKILEGASRPGVSDIRAVAERMAAHDGTPPVIFIDYMQLLRPENERDTDKQATDKNVTALRKLVQDLGTTVFAISSLNRSSYKGTIEQDSFKESGAIEYGSDVLLGLQPYNMRERVASRKQGQSEEARADEIVKETKFSNERELEVVVLKNRSGRIPRDGAALTYIPVSNVVYSGTKGAVPDMKAR